MAKSIKNLLLFKIGWLACVALAAAGDFVLATLSVITVVAVHLFMVPAVRKETALLIAAALIGLVWESLLVYAGLVSYPGSSGTGHFAPLWIVAMWVLFATTLNYGLSWIKRSWMIASVAGLVGGPLAFFSGASVGAVEFHETLTALAVIGAGWALLLPLLALVADTIIDSAWLEPRDCSLSTREAQRYGLLSHAQALLRQRRKREVGYVL
jgi:hypothetical protein